MYFVVWVAETDIRALGLGSVEASRGPVSRTVPTGL